LLNEEPVAKGLEASSALRMVAEIPSSPELIVLSSDDEEELKLEEEVGPEIDERIRHLLSSYNRSFRRRVWRRSLNREARSKTLRGVLLLGVVIRRNQSMILLEIIRLTLQTTNLEDR